MYTIIPLERLFIKSQPGTYSAYSMQKSRKTLIGLASALLHLNPEDIKDIEITNPIILGESINAKTFILDVNILLNNSRMLNLEMQVNNLHNWENRSLCYLCSDFSQLNKGDAYEDIKPALNPPFSSVYLCSKILPSQIVFEEIKKA